MTRASTHSGGEITERVIGLEHGLDSVERRLSERLDDGAETFSAIRRQLADFESRLQPKPADKWKAAGFVFGVAIALFTWVWQAARYPDRNEYAALASKVESSQASTETRLQALRESQLKTVTDIALLQQKLQTLADEIRRIEREDNRKRRTK